MLIHSTQKSQRAAQAARSPIFEIWYSSIKWLLLLLLPASFLLLKALQSNCVSTSIDTHPASQFPYHFHQILEITLAFSFFFFFKATGLFLSISVFCVSVFHYGQRRHVSVLPASSHLKVVSIKPLFLKSQLGMEIVEDILGSDESVYVGHVNIASSILARLPHLKLRPRKHSGVGAPANTASEDVSQHHTNRHVTKKRSRSFHGHMGSWSNLLSKEHTLSRFFIYLFIYLIIYLF